jgi:hypothetical protein
MSVCCLGSLPVVRPPQEALSTGESFTTSMVPLLDALSGEYPQLALDILKSRYCAIVDSADREALRCQWWDTRLFMLGFGGSLLVTIAAAVGQAGYMTLDSITVVNTIVLLLSSVATAALGLRERLKFGEKGDLWKRLSSVLQRRGFLFLSKSGKYADMPPAESLQMFMLDVENLKLQSDREHQALRSQQEEHHAKPVDGGAAAPAMPALSPETASADPVQYPPATPRTNNEPGGDLFAKEGVPTQDMMAVQGSALKTTRVKFGGGKHRPILSI